MKWGGASRGLRAGLARQFGHGFGQGSGNIIPDEVALGLTLRSLSHEGRDKLIRKIERLCEGIGLSAGLPREDWPKLMLGSHVPGLYNDPALTERLGKVFERVLGAENVSAIPPVMYGEDFARYGSVDPKIPILMYSLGSQKQADLDAAAAGKLDLPSTLQTGVLTMSAALRELLSAGE